MTDEVVTEQVELGQSTENNNWYDRIEDADLKGYTEKKGWKKPEDAIVSYKNLEGKLGTAIQLPSENATTEELSSFYSKIGRPENPEAYELPVPNGQSSEFAGHMSKIMFDSGLSKKSAHALATAWNDYQEKMASAYDEQQAHAEQQQMEELKSEWGPKYETNEIIAKNASKAFGVTGDQVDALQKVMGFGEVMKFFNMLGTKIGEDKFISGDNGAGADKSTMRMTKEEANSEYQRLIADKDFYKKYRAGDGKAVAIMNNVWKYK